MLNCLTNIVDEEEFGDEDISEEEEFGDEDANEEIEGSICEVDEDSSSEDDSEHEF